MIKILPLLLLPEPSKDDKEDAKPIASHVLLGRPVFRHAMKSLETVAGNCYMAFDPEGMKELKTVYSCEREAEAGFKAAVAKFLGNEDKVLAVHGEMPCLTPETLKHLAAAVDGKTKASFLQWQGEDLEQEPGLRLNGTAYCFDANMLFNVLKEWEGDECTPLDVLTALTENGEKITPVAAGSDELISVRTRQDFANAFSCLRESINNWHMSRGITILVPEATYIDADVSIGEDSVIYPGCHLQKGSKIGARCMLLPNCRLSGAVLSDDVTVENSVLINCSVGAGTTVGPFAYLRPDAAIGEKCRIGDFVEIKNSSIGDGTKISHLTYVGDAELGKNINLGCGVVFSNYDGKRKNLTVVEDDAFVGCNVNLVPPVRVGREAYVAAGSTVTEDVPEGALYVARARGTIKEGWVQKRKEDGKL